MSERLKKIKGELEDFMRLFGMNVSATGIPNEECCVVTYNDALFLVKHCERLTKALNEIEKETSNSALSKCKYVSEIASNALKEKK